MAKSVDSDQTQCSVASDLGLYCLSGVSFAVRKFVTIITLSYCFGGKVKSVVLEKLTIANQSNVFTFLGAFTDLGFP